MTVEQNDGSQKKSPQQTVRIISSGLGIFSPIIILPLSEGQARPDASTAETPSDSADTRQTKRKSKKVFRDLLGIYPKGGLSILFDFGRNKTDEDLDETDKPKTNVWY